MGEYFATRGHLHNLVSVGGTIGASWEAQLSNIIAVILSKPEYFFTKLFKNFEKLDFGYSIWNWINRMRREGGICRWVQHEISARKLYKKFIFPFLRGYEATISIKGREVVLQNYWEILSSERTKKISALEALYIRKKSWNMLVISLGSVNISAALSCRFDLEDPNQSLVWILKSVITIS